MIPLGISNSSPLIALSRIGRLDLLTGHFERLLVPEAVAAEVGDIPEWIAVTSVSQPRVLEIFPSTIHKGEAEVILLGLDRPDAVLILDDWYAREFARVRNFRVIGTVGLSFRARREGRLEAAMSILQQLADAGFRISDRVLAEVKHLTGE